ncbi:unnamed protein product [Mytilus edulis]|uniref:Uncharacterized protein n=1 Tax=Mytilus edulis TaxID=6550 RepID=A0A8S3PYG8_MYTED|nr:unnamed protein product [Mytilus edulis]
MSNKSFQLIDTFDEQVPTSSKIGGHDQNVDWFKCIFCQTDSLDTLQCPASARQNDTSAGYKTLSENLEQFNEINSLPSWLDLNKLNDGSGIQNTLIKSNAKWHKKCRLKFNTTELKRAQKRQHRYISDDGQASLLQEARKSTRLSLPCKIGLKDYVCFFCDSIEEDEMLREAATYGIDNRVRECAQKLQDTALLAKLSAGDLVAQEAKYHVKCLIYLYRKASRVANDDESEGGTQSRISHGIALAELVSFIEESRSEDNVAPVFKMSDLSKMYGNRLEKMGAEQEGRVHSTRLKNRLLTYVPDIEAYKQGRENLLAFKDDIGPALRRACEEDFDSNYMQIYKAVKIVRSDMMATSSEFNGTFAADCQEKSVPRSLLTLVNMLLYGPDITTDSFSQETLSIAQMLIFNSHKRIQKSNRHAKSRETPSQMYLGIVIHCQTRKRGLIDKLYKLGLSVSYDRILSVSASLTNTLCKQYQEDGYVCPPSLRLGLFTTAAVDNIDHNPSSTTAKDSFHGTGISLFQHVTTQMNGQQRLDFQLTSIQGGRVTESLPDSYAVVKPAVLKTNVPVIPVTDSTCKGCTGDLHEAVQNEYRWLETVSNSKEYDIEERTLVSWGAYHAEHEPIKDFEPCVSALLPLFEEEAKSVAMIKHSFDVIKTSVEALNPEEDEHHHENKTSVQKSFLKDIWSMVEVMNELGNPFMEDSQDLLVLDTKDIAPTSVVDTIRKIEKIGKTQYEKYIEDRLIKRTVPIFEPIKKMHWHYLELHTGRLFRQ